MVPGGTAGAPRAPMDARAQAVDAITQGPRARARGPLMRAASLRKGQHRRKGQHTLLRWAAYGRDNTSVRDPLLRALAVPSCAPLAYTEGTTPP